MLGALIPESIKQLFTKAATVLYPFEPCPVPEGFRGKLVPDNSLCIGCNICVRDCPAEAIEIVKTGEKQFKFVVYLDRCVYCKQCVDVCPKKVLTMSKEYELSSYDRASLKVG